jgi:magnesium transporter
MSDAGIDSASAADASSASFETAAEHALSQMPIAPRAARVGEVVALLRSRCWEHIDPIYVVDPDQRVTGQLRAADLLCAAPDEPIDAYCEPLPATARRGDDQEQVAGIAIHHGLAAVAVVDAGGRLRGVVPAEALMQILRREHVEDLHRVAGILREDVRARDAIEAPPARRVRHRLPWLLVGLAGSAIATGVVAHFESVLQAQVQTAFFVPAIVYLADAIGTQTEAIAVRAISLSRASLGSLLLGEIVSGLLIGAALALLAWPLVWLGFGDLRLATAVSLALLGAGGVATGVGLLLPWLLARAGSDPAFGSGPVATVIQDVLSLIFYFATAQLLLT